MLGALAVSFFLCCIFCADKHNIINLQTQKSIIGAFNITQNFFIISTSKTFHSWKPSNVRIVQVSIQSMAALEMKTRVCQTRKRLRRKGNLFLHYLYAHFNKKKLIFNARDFFFVYFLFSNWNFNFAFKAWASFLSAKRE